MLYGFKCFISWDRWGLTADDYNSEIKNIPESLSFLYVVIRNISMQWKIFSVLLVGLQCYVHMLNFTCVRWRCYAPAVWTSHSNRLSSSQFFTTEYSYLVSLSVAGRKPLSGTQSSLMVSQVTVNEMCLTKHERLTCRCPLLSLSRLSPGPMKRTPLHEPHFLWWFNSS